jgi:hypothetical protein
LSDKDLSCLVTLLMKVGELEMDSPFIADYELEEETLDDDDVGTLVLIKPIMYNNQNNNKDRKLVTV